MLSSYLDSELEPERSGELEAHLIGCTRCSTALGYLREESQRIGSLSRVHVDDHAAHQLFALVGIDEREDEPPPPDSWHEERPEADDVEPWLEPQRARALPWQPLPKPQPMEPEHDMADAAMSGEPSFVSEQEDLFEEPYREPQPEAAEVEPEPAQPVAAEVHEPALPEPIVPAAASAEVADDYPGDPDIDATGYPAPFAPPEPRPVATGGVGRFFNRVRDSVAVRFALMRGAPADEDAVQIVSGGGAPSWEGRPVHRGYMQRMEQRRWNAPSQHPAAHVEAPPIQPGPDVDMEHEAPGRAVPYTSRSPMTSTATALATAPPDTHMGWDVSQPGGPARTAVGPGDLPGGDHPEAAGPDATEVHTAAPGRHMRTVTRGQNGGRFAGVGQFTTAVARRTGAQHGPSVIGGVDRRLWIFGAAVVVLMLIGVLVGKASSPLPAATVTHPAQTPAVHATSAPTAAPSVAPTTAPTSAPTPTPVPQGGPSALTDVVDLGTGGTGFDVAGVRYGVNGPRGYRLVFDMNPGARSTGAPDVRIGFGNATTLYIEFAGTVAAGSPQPAPGGGVVTALTLVQPSPVPGKIVYQITLTHNVNFIANYLDGPRLVIDLR